MTWRIVLATSPRLAWPSSSEACAAFTTHAAQYLSDPAYRRKIARQLYKGESLHALRRDLHYARQGTTGKPHLAGQAERPGA